MDMGKHLHYIVVINGVFEVFFYDETVSNKLKYILITEVYSTV